MIDNNSCKFQKILYFIGKLYLYSHICLHEILQIQNYSSLLETLQDP